MYKKLILICAIIGVITLQNCKPDEPVDPEPTPIVAPVVTFPIDIKNVDGILAAIITTSKEGTAELTIGSAHAVFFKGKNPSMKLDGGTVKINTKATTKSDDNTYFYTSSAAEPNGLVYQKRAFWQASGNTATDVPAISNDDGTGFPNVPTVTGMLNLNSLQSKLIDWTSSNGADSVVLILKGPSGTYKRIFNNTVTSHSIPAAEIAKLGVGAGSLQIINYNLDIRAVGTKSYAFMKQCTGNIKVQITQ